MARRRRSGKKIDFVHWDGTRGVALTLSAGSAGQLIAAAGLQKPETLMRTRGNVLVFVDATAVPGTMVEVGLGLHVVPAGTGTTVTVAPLTDPGAAWFWYERFMIGYEEMVTDVIDVPGATSFRTQIDSKAMRIIGIEEEIQFVAENQTVNAAETVNVGASFRFLFGS